MAIRGPDQMRHIRLTVKRQDERVVDFQITRNTKLKKLLNAYCEHKLIRMSSVSFLFNGRVVSGDQTPSELGMEYGDVIDAMPHDELEVEDYEDSVSVSIGGDGDKRESKDWISTWLEG